MPDELDIDDFGLVIEAQDIPATEPEEEHLMGTSDRAKRQVDNLLGSIASVQDMNRAEAESSKRAMSNFALLRSWRQEWQNRWRDKTVTKGTYGEYWFHSEAGGVLPLYPPEGDMTPVLVCNGKTVNIAPYDNFLSDPTQVELLQLIKPDGNARIVVRTHHRPEYTAAPEKSFLSTADATAAPGGGSYSTRHPWDMTTLWTSGKKGEKLAAGLRIVEYTPTGEGAYQPPTEFRLVNYKVDVTTEGEMIQTPECVPIWDRKISAEVESVSKRQLAVDGLRMKLMPPKRWVAALNVGFDDPDDVAEWMNKVRKGIYGEAGAQRMVAEAAERIANAASRGEVGKADCEEF